MIDEQLRRAMVSSEMSLRELARRAGLAPAPVQRFAKGERDIRLATAAKIAEVLGIELTSNHKRRNDIK
jgi:transcriptional regulator with XRE-family HTH domain